MYVNITDAISFALEHYYEEGICFLFKGTLMQISKFLYMFVFISKQLPEHFTFLILIIKELFAREVCRFLKKKADF